MKNVIFAGLKPLDQTEDVGRFAAIAQDAFSALQADDGLSLIQREGGVALLHTRVHLDIGDVVTAFTLLASVALECPCTLTWQESDVRVEGREAAGLLTQWRDGHRPPALSIVQLVNAPLANDRVAHQTRGLRPFVGHELSIEIGPADQAVDLLNTLVTAAGHALVLGPEYRLRPIYNAAGRAAHLTPTSYPEIGSEVVKIEF